MHTTMPSRTLTTCTMGRAVNGLHIGRDRIRAGGNRLGHLLGESWHEDRDANGEDIRGNML